MSISLQKGQRVSLAKQGGGALSKVRMGLGWFRQFGGTFQDLLPAVKPHL